MAIRDVSGLVLKPVLSSYFDSLGRKIKVVSNKKNNQPIELLKIVFLTKF